MITRSLGGGGGGGGGERGGGLPMMDQCIKCVSEQLKDCLFHIDFFFLRNAARLTGPIIMTRPRRLLKAWERDRSDVVSARGAW